MFDNSFNSPNSLLVWILKCFLGTAMVREMQWREPNETFEWVTAASH